MRKNKSHVPFKETVQFSLRGFRVWWKENPMLLLSVLICGVVSSLTPYVDLRRSDAISFCDYLCKIMPQKLPATKSKSLSLT